MCHILPSCLFKIALPLLIARQDLTGIREKNGQRKGHSFQIGGNDNDSNDLRWFSTGIRRVWQLRRPKKCQALTVITISVWLTLCWHSNSKQDAVRRNCFFAVKCHGGIV